MIAAGEAHEHDLFIIRKIGSNPKLSPSQGAVKLSSSILSTTARCFWLEKLQKYQDIKMAGKHGGFRKARTGAH
jgi:hypothetical protein